ncbi:ATPase, histidine kinase-, DNA gyrase B-, and HSP90-like domain protein [Bacillus thuringiensis serovar huazhongensis BGSC 4BD1]|nr:ATPase, histidine kinase-, DNA gyrase B-, and HSP90-like domain protein [Bacillus thuringiensis serovar huazhongensis BGSC 4BD1]
MMQIVEELMLTWIQKLKRSMDEVGLLLAIMEMEWYHR